jgi:hypothetical protein
MAIRTSTPSARCHPNELAHDIAVIIIIDHLGECTLASSLAVMIPFLTNLLVSGFFRPTQAWNAAAARSHLVSSKLFADQHACVQLNCHA